MGELVTAEFEITARIDPRWVGCMEARDGQATGDLCDKNWRRS